jgi:hypothetical protein
MYPVGERDDDKYWVLELTGDWVRVLDHEDRSAGKWSPAKGVARFQMPSFWASRKKFGIVLEDGAIDFDVGAKDLRKIQAYADRVYVGEHPDAPTRALIFGGLMVAGGLAMIVVAAAVWYLTYERAANNPEGGRYLIWTGGIFVGICTACQGVYKMCQYSKWKRLAAESEDGDNDDR